MGMKSSHDLVPDGGHSFLSRAVDDKVAAQLVATHHQTTKAAPTLQEMLVIVQYEEVTESNNRRNVTIDTNSIEPLQQQHSEVESCRDEYRQMLKQAGQGH